MLCPTSQLHKLAKFFVCKGQLVDIWVAKLEQKEIQRNTTTLQFHDDINWLIRLHFKFLRLPIQCHLSIKPFPIACVMQSVKSTKYKFAIDYHVLFKCIHFFAFSKPLQQKHNIIAFNIFNKITIVDISSQIIDSIL